MYNRISTCFVIQADYYVCQRKIMAFELYACNYTREVAFARLAAAIDRCCYADTTTYSFPNILFLLLTTSSCSRLYNINFMFYSVKRCY